MEEHQFNDLSLPEKEALVKKNGRIIYAQDFYSFITISYLVNEHAVRLFYDFSGKLIDVETEAELTDEYAEAAPPPSSPFSMSSGTF